MAIPALLLSLCFLGLSLVYRFKSSGRLAFDTPRQLHSTLSCILWALGVTLICFAVEVL